MSTVPREERKIHRGWSGATAREVVVPDSICTAPRYNPMAPERLAMTPEERLSIMQNLLQTTMEHHAKQQEQIEKHTEQIKEQSGEIGKQNAGIRDLIIVSRTVLDSIQTLHEIQRKDHEEWNTRMEKLTDAQAATDENLHILIDTVDRIIRRRNGKPWPDL